MKSLKAILQLVRDTLHRFVRHLNLLLWKIQFTAIAWRRWRCLSLAWNCANAVEEPLEDRESPMDAVLTEESYAID